MGTAEFAALRLRLLKVAAVASRPQAARGMTRGRTDPLLAGRVAAARSLTAGASAFVRPTLSIGVAKYGSSGGEKPKAILRASSEETWGRIKGSDQPPPSVTGCVSFVRLTSTSLAASRS